MAEITKDSTLREILETYQSRQGRGPEFVTEGLKLFKDVADKPGSALDLFRPDDDGRTLAGKRFKAKELQNIEDGLDKGSGLIGPMKSIRLVGVDLKGVIGPKDNMYQYLPDEKTNTVVNKRIFEIKEPPKPVSLVAVNPNKKVLNELFVKVAEFKKNPQLEAVADALLFNIQNGLRANAAAGLQIGDYFPENMSIYIDAEAKGAKGKSVSVPLGALADSILQDRIKNNKVKEIDGVKHFFVKPNGKKVTSTDMTALLKRIKVDNILYDQKKKKYYNSLAPLDDAPGKTGSPLIRNLHTQLAFNADIVGGEGRIAYLQGRSLTSVKMDEVGDLIKYKVDFPGAIDPDGIDARNANKIGNIFAESAKKFGYDLSGKVPRITEKTKGFSDYFKSPVVDKAKDVPEKILTPKTPQDVVSSITAEEKEKLKLLGIDVEEAFKNVKTVGKAVIKKIPVVSGIAVTAEMLRRGVAPSTAFAYGASELLPISASDADTAGAFARKAREEGLPKAIGLDTEKQEQMNIMRKQRLADRVKRNTSVTPPPEEGFINQNEIGRQ
tara:strand:- start:43 stop:1701 length:1659 start_codon:yes stop_codon:yes gene_type:complete